MSKNSIFFRLKRTKNHVKPPPKPHGVSVKIPHPRGFFKVNSPPPWGMGVGTPWGPHGVWGWGPNPTCVIVKSLKIKQIMNSDKIPTPSPHYKPF